MAMVCDVLINNSACTVIKYGEQEFQIPPIGKEAETVNVEFKDGVCTVVDDKPSTKMKKKVEAAN